MSRLGQYRAQDLAIILGGHLVTGLAPGTFVNIDRNEESFALIKGADGEGCRSATNNGSGRMTFTTLQSSKSNDFLSALVVLDEQTGDGVVPMLCKDNSGTSVHSAESAWLVKPTPTTYAVATENREWIVEMNDLVPFAGSN